MKRKLHFLFSFYSAYFFILFFVVLTWKASGGSCKHDLWSSTQSRLFSGCSSAGDNFASKANPDQRNQFINLILNMLEIVEIDTDLYTICKSLCRNHQGPFFERHLKMYKSTKDSTKKENKIESTTRQFNRRATLNSISESTEGTDQYTQLLYFLLSANT